MSECTTTVRPQGKPRPKPVVNTKELEIAMKRKGKGANELAAAIGKSRTSFNQKKYGEVAFTLDEVNIMTNELSLLFNEVSDIFFDGMLRDCGADGVVVNTSKLLNAMAQFGKSEHDIAVIIGRSVTTLNHKLYGNLPFTFSDVVAIATTLPLTLEQTNDIFFGGKLHSGKFSACKQTQVYSSASL